MITRPLDLSSKLQPPPRNLDSLFYVNVALLVFFFALFGSRFVLMPGFGVDFRLPSVAGANANARPVTHAITVDSAGRILTNDGVQRIEDLEKWLVSERKGTKEPVLLARADADVRGSVILLISKAAEAAGFVMPIVWAADEPSDGKTQKGR
jgi:biopolymer transport protein ExbD